MNSRLSYGECLANTHVLSSVDPVAEAMEVLKALFFSLFGLTLSFHFLGRNLFVQFVSVSQVMN